MVMHQRMIEAKPNARLPDFFGYGYSHRPDPLGKPVLFGLAKNLDSMRRPVCYIEAIDRKRGRKSRKGKQRVDKQVRGSQRIGTTGPGKSAVLPSRKIVSKATTSVKLTQAEAEFCRLIADVSQPGFYGTAGLALHLQDGHSQHLRRTVERMLR